MIALKKYIKIVLIPVLGILLPFALTRISVEYGVSDLAIIMYLYPLYLPVLCGWFGVKIFKETGKVFFPTMIFNIFLLVGTYYLTVMILNSIERSLGDAALVLLFFGPAVYSAPISPIAAAICKYKKKKAEVQKNNEDDTTAETQI